MNKMDYSANFPAVSSTVFVATREVYSDYLEALPKHVKEPHDLRKLRAKKSWGRERTAPHFYNEIKETLYKMDDELDKMIDKLSELSVDEIKNSLDRTLEEYSTMKHLHKISMSMKDLLGWVNDDYLLSTILFHMELAENFIFSIDIGKIKQDLKDTKKMEARIKETVDVVKENKEMLRAIIILSLEPLLIWSALYARRSGDYHYILQYEKEVALAARAITNVKPQITLKMMREAM